MTSALGPAIPDSECLVLPVVGVAVVGKSASEGAHMKVRVGIDIACRSPHHAAIADEAGNLISSRHRFGTVAAELAAFWESIPSEAAEVMVIMEPTRNAWVPLAGWFRRQGAKVVIVPAEQSADLRDYMSKHTKTDRLDAELLARLPVLHPQVLHPAEHLGPGDPLKRAVKIRSGLVQRRTTAMQRLDSLLEILGPGWTEVLGTRMTQTAFRFLAQYANPHQVKRLGASRLARWFSHHTRKAWGPERAQHLVDAANETIALWGNDGLDYEALAADIATEATIALEVSEQIALLDRRIADLCVDPQLAARYQRLMCDTGRHHNSAICTIATVLLTRIVSCLRQGTPYQLRDTDNHPITDAEGRAIVADRYQIPDAIRAARRSISNARSTKRRDERLNKNAAKHTETPPALTPA